MRFLRVFGFCIRNERAADDSHVFRVISNAREIRKLKSHQIHENSLCEITESDSPVFYNLKATSQERICISEEILFFIFYLK